MSEEELEILRDKFLKYHLEYKDEEMLFEIIDKLQKENEKLDRKFRYAVPDEMIEELYVSKDKIRDKIKKLEKTKNYITSMYAIGILEELLGDE